MKKPKNMKIIHTQRYVKESPTKIRLVTSLLKGMPITQAITSLPFINKRASGVLRKTLLGALSLAKEKNFAENDLTIESIEVGEGPRLKRGTPVSRGRWHPILKRMSHIRIVLNAKEVKKDGTKS